MRGASGKLNLDLILIIYLNYFAIWNDFFRLEQRCAAMEKLSRPFSTLPAAGHLARSRAGGVELGAGSGYYDCDSDIISRAMPTPILPIGGDYYPNNNSNLPNHNDSNRRRCLPPGFEI